MGAACPHGAPCAQTQRCTAQGWALSSAAQHVHAASWAAAGARCRRSICPAPSALCSLSVQLWSRGCSFSFCRSSPRGPWHSSGCSPASLLLWPRGAGEVQHCGAEAVLLQHCGCSARSRAFGITFFWLFVIVGFKDRELTHAADIVILTITAKGHHFAFRDIIMICIN